MNNVRNYELKNQEKNMCFPCCLQMVLERNNQPVQSQKQIASYFKDFELGGISINDINKEYFIPRGIDLHEDFLSFSFLNKYDDDLTDFMKKFNNSDYDAILFTNFSRLTKSQEDIDKIEKDDVKLNLNHCFLFKEIKDKDNVYLVCPEIASNGGTEIIKTSLKKIFNSMYNSGSRSGLGISYISRK